VVETKQLLGLAAGWDAEGQPAVFVRFGGCGQVQIRERNFLGVLRSEVPESLADYGVVANFLFVLIAKY
jgi:hypothetical protein